MQQCHPTADAQVSVNLTADMREVFRRGLLADVVEQAGYIKDSVDRGLEVAPVTDVSDDVRTAVRLLGASMAMLDEIGWGDRGPLACLDEGDS